MSISAAMGISVSGMRNDMRRLNDTAQAVASGGSSSSTTSGSAPVDPASAMIDVINTRQSFAANAAVFETGADMWDMLMSMKKD
jgi:flagellar basal-body rod protein FlgC